MTDNGRHGRERQNPPILVADELPSAFMHHAVMAMAKQDEVREVGLPQIPPTREPQPRCIPRAESMPLEMV